MMNKERIELQLLLPNLPDSGDACVTRLAVLLASKVGIDSLHAIKSEDGKPDQICIHYDPRIVSTGDVRELAKRAGVELDQRYGRWIKTSPTVHASRASAIESRLTRIDGVLEAVMSPDGTARVEYDRNVTNESVISDAFNEWAHAATEPRDEPASHAHDDRKNEADHDHRGHDHTHGGIFGTKTKLIFAVLCGAFLLLGWLLETFANLANWISIALFVIAYFFGSYFTIKEDVEKIRAGKFEIDFLMIVAAAGAAALGAWAEGALLLFLFSIGHSLEGYAMGRAKRAIEALAELTPRVARVRRDGQETELAVEKLIVGDIVIVKPDERIAADAMFAPPTAWTKGSYCELQSPSKTSASIHLRRPWYETGNQNSRS